MGAIGGPGYNAVADILTRIDADMGSGVTLVRSSVNIKHINVRTCRTGCPRAG